MDHPHRAPIERQIHTQDKNPWIVCIFLGFYL